MTVENAVEAVTGERLVFLGGLHRSGTTPLARAMGSHPEISGLSGTDVAEDEGQHLQDVYPRIKTFGGMGRFARSAAAHLTEESPLVSPESARRLVASYAPYWDLERRLLLEKTPANLIMGRFLQALFPGSALVVVVRHPIVAALALEKWNPLVVNRRGRRRTTLSGRVQNWMDAHAYLSADLSHLPRALVLRYEDLVDRPVSELARVRSLLELGSPIPADSIRPGRSAPYTEKWEQMSRGTPLQRRTRRRIIERFGPDMTTYGYDPETLTTLPLGSGQDPWPLSSRSPQTRRAESS
jgi:hypothetical protein